MISLYGRFGRNNWRIYVRIINKFYEQYCVERQKSENFQIPLVTLKYYDIFIITYCVAPFNE